MVGSWKTEIFFLQKKLSEKATNFLEFTMHRNSFGFKGKGLQKIHSPASPYSLHQRHVSKSNLTFFPEKKRDCGKVMFFSLHPKLSHELFKWILSFQCTIFFIWFQQQHICCFTLWIFFSFPQNPSCSLSSSIKIPSKFSHIFQPQND